VKPPLSSRKIFGLSDAIQNDASAVGVPEPQMAAQLRALGAMAELLEAMPRIVCLIGSTRFFQDFADLNLSYTLRGYIVLSIGCDTKKDGDLNYTQFIKDDLDKLHMWKLILCDEVVCINRDGYIGESTAREIGYARMLGKEITWFQPQFGARATYDFPTEMALPLALAKRAGMEEDFTALPRAT
jgi:hypothetical protein